MDFQIFRNIHKFVRGPSNLLLSNIYRTAGFKTLVFFALLNKESPKRSISESRELFLSKISSSTL